MRSLHGRTAHQFDLDDFALLDTISHRAARATAVVQNHEGLFTALATRKVTGRAHDRTHGSLAESDP